MSKEQRGIIINNSSLKTILVQTEILIKHPKYQKIIKKLKRYQVHDEFNIGKIGDIILFKQTAPISRNKHWILIKIF
jgi:small subunit ribosomal protein S17